MSRRHRDDMRPRPWRRRVVLAGWLLASLAITLRAGQIQLLQASTWERVATRQHEGAVVLPAARGTILASDGVPLSVTRERVQVYVAPGEVTDADAVKARLTSVLGLSSSRASSLVSGRSGWKMVGLYSLAVRDSLEGLSGLHLESLYQRYYPHGEIARGLVGVVIDGEGRGGVERRFDAHLRGTAGSQIVARDSRGVPIPGQRLTIEEPRAGGEVVLTLDMELQEIAQSALEDAIEEHDAVGGDILITDPHTGEIRALFSSRNGDASALSAINTPFEPGSTLKAITVAGLLHNGLASLNDEIDTGDGRWTVNGRTLHDTHTEGRMTLRNALIESSNVGVAKAALAMPEGIQYQNLRDFGFGTLTGIQLPGEVAGVLRAPEQWSLQSPQSLAIGYEMSATPLQMAMAYGAIANGGTLMRPRLVREVRDANGTVLERYDPEPIRRVVDESTARAVGRALVDAVRDGTGTRARIGTFQVAGKSGTARFATNGRYEAGDYSSSFVGYFPADDPQLVIFVKLDRPGGGEYYGGAVAAPVTRRTMEAALAANTLDLGKLASASRRPVVQVPSDLYTTFVNDEPTIPLPPEGPELVSGVQVPDVTGLPARSAVRELHKHGLRVADVGVGDVVRTFPGAGTIVPRGDVVRLRYEGQEDD